MSKLILQIKHEEIGGLELEFAAVSELIAFLQKCMRDEGTTSLLLKGE